MSGFASAPDVFGWARVVESGLYGGRAAVLSVTAPAGILDAVALVGPRPGGRFGGRPNESPAKSSSSWLAAGRLSPKIDGSPVATIQEVLGRCLRGTVRTSKSVGIARRGTGFSSAPPW